MLRRQLNALPFCVVYDPESRTSTIADRLRRPLVTVPGRYPRCDMSLAVAAPADATPLYGAKPIATFYRPDDSNAPFADPAVRKRLCALSKSCGALREELRRRDRMNSAGAEPERPEPTKAEDHASLIQRTFATA